MSRIKPPGDTDLHWMSVVCTPDETHAEFHETSMDAADAARAALTIGTSVYVGRIDAQGEHRVRPDGGTIVLSFQLDHETRAALRNHNGSNTRKAFADTLRALLLADIDQIRDEYRARLSGKRFEPWAKCKSVDVCKAAGRCCNACQGVP